MASHDLTNADSGSAFCRSHRQRYSSAQKLYSNLPAHYVDLRWSKIESSLLTQCTRLQGQLDMAKERLLSTLALIRAGVEQGARRWSLDALAEGAEDDVEAEEKRAQLARALMGDVYDLSGKLSKGELVGTGFLFATSKADDAHRDLRRNQTSPRSRSRPSACGSRANGATLPRVKTA